MTNTRDLGIGSGPGKGDKSRVTSVKTYRSRFPEGMGPKAPLRSYCCEAPLIVCGNVTQWFECATCRKPCTVRAVEIT